MKIVDSTKRTVRLTLDRQDLVEYFSEKTGMENIDGFNWYLTDNKGNDHGLNKGMDFITLIGDNRGEK